MAPRRSRDSWTRRDVLALPLAAAVSACRRSAEPGTFSVPARSAVSILPAKDYSVDFADLVFRGLETLRVDVRGKNALLKPNLVEYESGSCVNTHPMVVVGTAAALMRAGARSVVVGEGPGHRRDIEYLLASSGLIDLLREARITFVDLNHDDVKSVALRSHLTGLSEILLPASVLAADLVVSLPKLKTHHWAGMTGGMKNLFGTVPGSVYGWPKNFLHVHGIPESIVDLTSTIRPGLTVVDGVVAMEGDGPIMGSPRTLGLVAMGADVVAVDATCARIIGLDPSRMPYLVSAARFLGCADASKIDQRGEPPARYATRFSVVDEIRTLQSPADQ
jgi:uncharacterized protein (DUF362 family)